MAGLSGRVHAGALALGVVVAGPGVPAVEVRAQDKIVGAMWEITFRFRETKTTEVRRFRATPDGKVYASGSPREIGTWTGSDDDVTMTLTGLMGPNAKSNGTYRLVKFRKNPPTWRGTFTAPRGREIPVGVKLLRD